jgi:hypothetical protein
MRCRGRGDCRPGAQVGILAKSQYGPPCGTGLLETSGHPSVCLARFAKTDRSGRFMLWPASDRVGGLAIRTNMARPPS